MAGDYAAPTAKAGHHGIGLKLVRESEREPEIEAIEIVIVRLTQSNRGTGEISLGNDK